MNILGINNVSSFQGSRELFAREVLKNKMAKKTISEIFAPSELRAATENLLTDLNSLGLQKISKTSEGIINKSLFQEAPKTYKNIKINL